MHGQRQPPLPRRQLIQPYFVGGSGDATAVLLARPPERGERSATKAKLMHDTTLHFFRQDWVNGLDGCVARAPDTHSINSIIWRNERQRHRHQQVEEGREEKHSPRVVLSRMRA